MNVLLSNYGDVTAVQFAAVCAVLVLIMGALYLGTNLKDKWFPKDIETKPIKVPNPLPVELVKSLATLDDLDKLRAEVKHEIEGLRKDMKDDDNGIHRRVGAISVKLATVDGKLNTISNNLNLLIEKAVK